jgi:hypothetical protein
MAWRWFRYFGRERRVGGLLEFIAGRWSPRAFDPRSVVDARPDNRGCRWAASSFNGSPGGSSSRSRDPHRSVRVVPGRAERMGEARAGGSSPRRRVLAQREAEPGCCSRPGLADAAMTTQAMQRRMLVHLRRVRRPKAQVQLRMPGDMGHRDVGDGPSGQIDILPEPLGSGAGARRGGRSPRRCSDRRPGSRTRCSGVDAVTLKRGAAIGCCVPPSRVVG